MKHLKNFKRYSLNEKYNDATEPSEEEMLEFWKFVEKADWKSDGNFSRVKDMLKAYYNEDQIKSFHNAYQYLIDDLYTRFESDWLAEPGIEVSDDGWWDLRAEIVGRGKDFYENISVKIMQDMAIQHDYTENFGYSFQID